MHTPHTLAARFLVAAWLTGVVASAAEHAAAEPILWDPAAGGNAHFYEAVPAPGGIAWEEARLAASGRTWEGVQGQLVMLESSEENAWIWESLDQPAGYWLGGYQPAASPEPDGGWLWVSGEPVAWTNWAVGQPDNVDDADRIQFSFSLGDGTWNDLCAPCISSGYIVEYAPPATSADLRTWGSVKALF